MKLLKKHYPKRNFYKQIAVFDNNLFIFENWKWLSCREFVIYQNRIIF